MNWPLRPALRLVRPGRVVGLLVRAQAAGVALALAAGVATAGPSQGPRSGAPHKKAGQEPLDFRGPGRDDAEPDVSEVVIGWFGPDDPAHPEFGEFWRGAALALEEENAAGGYRGKPFRLVASWSESPWQAGVVGVTRLVYEQGVWAVIGGVDGTTTHLAVQLALKSHFLLLSPGSSDVTADLANVPWLFSLPPSDERIAPLLADTVAQASRGGSFVVVAATDHDSHAALVATRRALASRRLVPDALVEVAAEGEAPEAVASRLLETQPRVVLVLAPSRLGARLVAALRGADFVGAIVGGAPLGRNAFRRAAGAAAEGVLVPLSAQAGPGRDAFARVYRRRWGEPPDEAALRSHDAVRLVAAAVRRAGLNRARIRDAVRALAPWAGVAGPVVWDAVGRNESAVGLGAWSGGRLASLGMPPNTEKGLAGPRPGVRGGP